MTGDWRLETEDWRLETQLAVMSTFTVTGCVVARTRSQRSCAALRNRTSWMPMAMGWSTSGAWPYDVPSIQTSASSLVVRLIVDVCGANDIRVVSPGVTTTLRTSWTPSAALSR